MGEQLAPLHAAIEFWLDHNRDNAIVVLDAQGTITAWLGAAEQFFGHVAHEVLGRNLELLFTPEDRDNGLPAYELRVAAEVGKADVDRWFVRKDGNRIWVTGTVTAMGAPGAPELFVKVLQDRTDLRIHIEQLERKLHTAEAFMASAQDFLGTLGHELRNSLPPLNCARIMLEHDGGARPVAVAGIVGAQVKVLKRLADDLLDLTRLDLGRLQLRRERIDLGAFARRVAHGLEQEARAHGVQLEAVVPDCPLDVEADQARMEQVFLNLVTNALKYTPAGGRVWIKAVQEGSEIVTRVEDNGMGIDPAVLPRIFELFTQEQRAEEFSPGGLGIGLALVRKLVELHGGTVQARSAGKGKGAEFIVRLPCMQAEQGAAAAAAATA